MHSRRTTVIKTFRPDLTVQQYCSRYGPATASSFFSLSLSLSFEEGKLRALLEKEHHENIFFHSAPFADSLTSPYLELIRAST